jgi:hypothetical protein
MSLALAGPPVVDGEEDPLTESSSGSGCKEDPLVWLVVEFEEEDLRNIVLLILAGGRRSLLVASGGGCRRTGSGWRRRSLGDLLWWM